MLQQDNTPPRRLAYAAFDSNWPLIVFAGIIGLATLLPTSNTIQVTGPCLFCGRRGLADALLNMVLFAPFGAVLSLRFPARTTLSTLIRVLTISLVASVTIELLQFLIPGRDPTLGDTVFNTIGSGVGAALAFNGSAIIFPDRRIRRFITFATVLLALAAFWCGSWLLKPSFPELFYYGQWTPEFENMERYSGQVVAANVGFIRTPSDRIPRSTELRAELLGGMPLRVTVIAGEPPAGPAPIFNFFDDGRREIIMLAADGADLVLSYRTRSAALRLDQPRIRVRGALSGLQAGSLFVLEVRRVHRGFCVQVNNANHCPLGFRIGRQWGILASLETNSGRLESGLDLVWLLLLFAPTGLWAAQSSDRELAVLLGAAGLALIPSLAGALSSPFTYYLAVAAGVALGWAGRKALQAVRAVTPEGTAPASARAETSSSTQRPVRS